MPDDQAVSSGSVPATCVAGPGGGPSVPGGGAIGRGRERQKNIIRPPAPPLALLPPLLTALAPETGLPWAGLCLAALDWVRRCGTNRSATSLAPAMIRARATTMSPSTSAVAADMFSDRVKLPACGEPVSATGLLVVPVAGVGTTATGVIVGRSLATSCGVSTVEGTGASVTGGTVGSATVLTGLTAATGLVVGAVLAGAVLAAVLLGDGDGDGDGLAEAVPLTVTVPDVAGSAAMAGLTAASAVAVSVTAVTDELALAGTAICACIE